MFRKLLKYYDEDVVSGAGLRIRRMAKAADELPPTERVKRIAEIFSHFRNPDKETVLTPWRVVNLHLSNMVGGYCFLNEQFDSQEVLEEPRLVDQGQVTEDIFLNPEARILEDVLRDLPLIHQPRLLQNLLRIELLVEEAVAAHHVAPVSYTHLDVYKRQM